MPEYRDFSINNMVDVLNDEYYLPDIQRNYVWDEKDICYLFDSIMKNYPINTFLAWRIDNSVIKEIKEQYGIDLKKYKFIINNTEKNALDTEPKTRYALVLDGQQRLTSMLIAFKGEWRDSDNVAKELYFNVLSGEGYEKDKDVEFEFSFLKREQTDNNIRVEQFINNYKKIKQQHFDSMLVSLAINNKDEADLLRRSYELMKKTYNLVSGINPLEEKRIEEIVKIRRYKLWVNVKSIKSIRSSGMADVKKYLNDLLVSTEQYSNESGRPEIIINNIHDFYNKLNERTVVSFKEVQEANYDKVLDIFVRINSGGEKLTYSDLLLSKMKIPWQGVKEIFDNLISGLNTADYDFDVDFIIKVCLVFVAKKTADVKYKAENISDTRINEIKAEWEKIKKALILTIELLQRFGITSKKILKSNNSVIPIAYWLYIKGYKAIGEGGDNVGLKEQETIRLWLNKALIRGIFSGQSDDVLYSIKSAIDGKKEGIYPAEDIEQDLSQDLKKAMTIDLEKFLEGVLYQDRNSYLVLNIIYKGNVNFNPLLRGNMPEQDHIFSKDALSRRGVEERKINSIYNLRLIEKIPNIQKSNKPLDEWIGPTVDDETRKIYELHGIPDSGQNVWTIERFEEFIAARKEEIKNRFKY